MIGHKYTFEKYFDPILPLFSCFTFWPTTPSRKWPEIKKKISKQFFGYNCMAKRDLYFLENDSCPYTNFWKKICVSFSCFSNTYKIQLKKVVFLWKIKFYEAPSIFNKITIVWHRDTIRCANETWDLILCIKRFYDGSW